jgi:cytochrome c oxidase subunit IV
MASHSAHHRGGGPPAEIDETHSGGGHATGGGAHDVLPSSVYWKTFGFLMVLLLLTVAAAFVDLEQHGLPIPYLNISIALVIAVAKATAVVLYFMHVKAGTKLTWVWAAVGFAWLLIMFGITFADYTSRDWLPVQGWEAVPDSFQQQQ